MRPRHSASSRTSHRLTFVRGRQVNRVVVWSTTNVSVDAGGPLECNEAQCPNGFSIWRRKTLLSVRLVGRATDVARLPAGCDGRVGDARVEFSCSSALIRGDGSLRSRAESACYPGPVVQSQSSFPELEEAPAGVGRASDPGGHGQCVRAGRARRRNEVEGGADGLNEGEL